MSSYRVLMIVQEYPDDRTLKGIWAEQQVRALSAQHGCRVVLAEETAGLDTGISLYERHGIPVMRSRFRQVRRRWWLPFLAAVIRGVRETQKEFRPQLLHAHMGTRAGWAAVVAGKLLRLPVVVTEHWGTLGERLSGDRLAAWALRYAIRNAGEWIAVSRALAEEIDALRLRPPVPVIGNVLDPIFIRDYQAPPAGPELRMVCAGRIDNRAKGLDTLLQALAQLGDQSWRLEVLGDGPARSEYESMSVSLGLGDRVSFRGWLAPEQVAEQLQAADAFVMPSDYETFGLAYFEALACGRPIIGCTAGALPELIPEWAGMLVPPRDSDSLAAAIRELAETRSTYDGPRLVEYARSKCSPEAFRQAVTEIYDRIGFPHR